VSEDRTKFWTVTTVSSEDAQRGVSLSDGTFAVALVGKPLTTARLAEMVPDPIREDEA
jgi:hypothetical protein